MNKRYLFCLLSLLLPLLSIAQQTPFNYNEPVTKRAQQRDLRDSALNHKRFGRAAIEFGLSELGPFSVDRFIRNVDYAKISWKSTAYNLNPGHWAWDNDPFQTNQFAHPYHGSYFFNAFRTNGYSFWQSVPATFAGSYLWETFGEQQAPAPNDFINTSFGGAILGETTYRLANKIIDNHSRGFKRQVNEVIALIIAPTNGINRILDGKWGKVGRNTQEHDSSKIVGQLNAGYRRFNTGENYLQNNTHGGWYLQAKLLYGTPYENFRKPFSNIIINAEIGKDDSTSLNTISVYGSIVGFQLDKNEDKIKHLLVLSANYDYIHNVAFSYGGQSVKFNLYSTFQPTEKIKINTTVGAGLILLAAIPDSYYYNGRSYDYGSGLAINGGAQITLADKLWVAANYRGGLTGTINGNSSHYFLHLVAVEAGYQFFKNIAFNAETGYFNLHSAYPNHPDDNKSYPYLKLSAKYAFNIR